MKQKGRKKKQKDEKRNKKKTSDKRGTGMTQYISISQPENLQLDDFNLLHKKGVNRTFNKFNNLKHMDKIQMLDLHKESIPEDLSNVSIREYMHSWMFHFMIKRFLHLNEMIIFRRNVLSSNTLSLDLRHNMIELSPHILCLPIFTVNISGELWELDLEHTLSILEKYTLQENEFLFNFKDCFLECLKNYILKRFPALDGLKV